MASAALVRLRRHPEFRAAVTMVPGALFILIFLLLPGLKAIGPDA